MAEIAHLWHTNDAFVLVQFYSSLSSSFQHGGQVCIVLLLSDDCNAIKPLICFINPPLKIVLTRYDSKGESFEPVPVKHSVEGHEHQ